MARTKNKDEPIVTENKEATPTADEMAVIAALHETLNPEPPKVITFRSVREEPLNFQINGHWGERDGTTKFLVWRLKTEEEGASFDAHYHIRFGRVERK